MRTLAVLLTLSTLFSISSCQKWNKEKKEKASFYYSTDFKSGEGTVMEINVNDIDYLYTAFFYEGKILKYKLVAERASVGQKNEVLAYQEGNAIVNKSSLEIQFKPHSGVSFNGAFENEKKRHKATIPGLELRDINFVLKK
jgi:hypothetical protein